MTMQPFKRRSTWLLLFILALAAQPALAADAVFESAYDRAVKAYHAKDWVEQPDEQLIRANRIKWNRLAKAA
ncbi:MAG: hypothetical protein RQ715_11525, partial [Methylococcales bacterium]|nr:hypothetical protein [Methylococcales bacterium]